MIRFGEWVISSSLPRPREVVIELSTDCNMDCPYCFRKAMGVEPSYMDRDSAVDVIEQCARIGVERILFSGWGEPTIHPFFRDLVWLAREKGIEVVVNTNGSTLEKLAEDLVEAGVSEVVVSVDFFDEELYRRSRGASMKPVLEGLDALLNEKRSRGARRPRVTVHFVVTKMNVDELRRFPDFAKRYSVSKLEVSHVVPLSAEMEAEIACFNDRSCVESLEKSLEEIGKYMFSHYFEVVLPRNRPSVERRCPYASAGATFVSVDGYVAPCLLYAHPGKHSFDGVVRELKRVVFGNVAEGIDTVWRKPSYVAFRARATLSLMPSCLDCPLARFCEPTLSNERDCWGNTPTCSHCPFSHRIATCPL